jgi:hypothetical protein
MCVVLAQAWYKLQFFANISLWCFKLHSDAQLFNKSTPTNNVVYSLHYNITDVSANMNELKMNYKVMSECQ